MSTNEERFEAIFRSNYRRVLAYSLRRAPAHVAEDVVSDVFAVAWKRIEKVPSEPLPWLLAVAHKLLANQRRGSRRRTMLLEALRERTSSSPASSGASSDAVRTALAALRPDDRELLTLVAWDGLLPAEAAQVLDISAATCRVRLHRARKRFGSALSAATSGQPIHPVPATRERSA